MFAGILPVYAHHGGLPVENATLGECMVDRYNVTKPASVSDLNCTSNDVQLAIYQVLIGPNSCLEGEVIDVQLRGDFIATSAERWDVGAFISIDGGTPNSLTTAGGGGFCVGGGPTAPDLCLSQQDKLDCVDAGGACDGSALCYQEFLHPVSPVCVGGTLDGEYCGDDPGPSGACELNGGTCPAANTDLDVNSRCDGGSVPFTGDRCLDGFWCDGGTDNGDPCPLNPDATVDDTACVSGGGTCLDPSVVCVDSGGSCTPANGPYYNGESTEDPADLCADIQQGVDATYDTQLFPIVCQDSNGNGLADVTSCTVWANSRSDGSELKPSCFDEGDITAETTAKCTCEPVDILGIDFEEQAQIEVVKDLNPPEDGGLFNLKINGSNYCEDGITTCTADADCAGIGGGTCVAIDVGDGGTTTPVTVSAGTNDFPGATHTVGEVAGTGTDLFFYDTSILCEDRGLGTFGGTCSGGTAGICDDDGSTCVIGGDPCPGGGSCVSGFACDPNGTADTDHCTAGGGTCVANGSPLTLDPGSGPLDVPVVPGQDVLCTITNTRNCEGIDCSDLDNACNTGVCSETADGPVCVSDPFSPTTICRSGSGDICDPAESCTGVAGEDCPADVVAPSTTICNAGSGDICDPDESCTGVAGEACPDDTIAPATTICREGSGDICDPDESCSGIADQACPPDTIAPATTTCREGSGDICDPDESCTGEADQACPPDTIAPATTTCREGSGDICDPDESCTGVAGAACPPDNVAPATTICNAGSGDICDPDESCTGVPGAACPDDTIAPATTICRTGSGDICDPDESCTGIADQACPDDVVTPATTICNAGSGDICDPDESCTGTPGEACPDDTIAPATTICRPGSGDICDPDESCTGAADVACPADVVAPATTVCNPGSGDICDPDESCTGEPGAACPDDIFEPETTVCRVSGTGDEVCDPAELCPGLPGAACPPEYEEPEGTPCGDDSTTECTDPDTCDGLGYCVPNNKPCGSATDSQLCQYDMEPTKGTCVVDGEPVGGCYIDDPCVQGGGLCEEGVCVGGTEDGLDCTVPDTDPCEDGGGSCIDGLCVGGSYDGVTCCYALGGECEQSDQFRLLFSPDVQNWVAYKLNASNPGQTFYNVIYDASGVGGDLTLTITIPYPYITVGGNPLHVFDAETVGSNGEGCLDTTDAVGVPITALTPFAITLDDWVFGVVDPGDYNLVCSMVTGPNGSGSCTFDVTIPYADIPVSGLIYLNVHLDYGLKGNFIDANPWDTFEDRYDRHAYISPWASSDALVDTDTDDGQLAVADCQAYVFEHTDGITDPLFEDQLENLNLFKRIAGAFGRVYCATSGDGFEYYLELVHPTKGVVQSSESDDDGYYALAYKHRGKPTLYEVKLYDTQGGTLLHTEYVELQGNGWGEVNFWANECEPAGDWDSSVEYGTGRNKTK